MDSNHISDAMVLLSGGVDSAACLAFLLEQGPAEAMFIDYGQAAAAKEVASATAVALHYGVELRTIRCVGATPKQAGLITGRNAFLIFTALLESNRSLLATGIHAGTRYWDCGPTFVKTIQSVCDGYADGRVRIFAPFVEWTKRQIWDYCISHDVPVDLTYSCEAAGAVPCGSCESCRDREGLRAC